MATGKEVGGAIGGTSVIEDNRSDSVKILSEDLKAYVQIDTTDSAEQMILAGGGATVSIGADANVNLGQVTIVDPGTSTGVNPNDDMDTLVVESRVTGGITFASHNSHAFTLAWADAQATASGQIRYTHNDDFMYMQSASGIILQSGGANERLRIDNLGKIATGGEASALCSAGGIHLLTGTQTGQTAHSDADDLVIESTAVEQGISFLGAANTRQRIQFGDVNNSGQASITFDHDGNDMAFMSSGGQKQFYFLEEGYVQVNTNTPTAMLVAQGNLDTNLSDSTSVISDGDTGTNRYVASTSHGLVIGQAVKIDGAIYTVADFGTDAAPAVDPLADHFILDSDHGSTGDKGQAHTDPSLFKVLTGDSKTALEVTAKRELVMETLGGVDAFAVRTANGVSDDCVVEICPGGPGNGFLKFYSNTAEKLVINCDSTYSYFSSYSDMYFQTETNSDILFFPNGTGQVAIGTDAPTSLFHATTSTAESVGKFAQTGDHQNTCFVLSSASTDRGPAYFTATAGSFDDGAAYPIIRCIAEASESANIGMIGCYTSGGSEPHFLVKGDGSVSAGTTYAVVHADYAEYFETTDGGSIAVGSSVVLEGGKVRAAQAGEQPMGVVRPTGTSSVIGNNPWNHWKDRYLRDDFGAYLKEPYTITEWTEVVVENSKAETLDDETSDVFHSYASDGIPDGLTPPDDATVSSTNKSGEPWMRKVQNPDYDDSLEYVKREDRDEWVIVGLMGQVPISKGQPLADSWVKMRDVSDSVEMYLIK